MIGMVCFNESEHNGIYAEAHARVRGNLSHGSWVVLGKSGDGTYGDWSHRHRDLRCGQNTGGEGLNSTDLRTLVIMRGTGHNMEEIAKTIGCSQQAVSYNLKKLKQRADHEGVDSTLASILIEAAWHKADMAWWMEHYRTSAKWLIRHLEALCESKGGDEQLKSLVRANLPAFKQTYGVDL